MRRAHLLGGGILDLTYAVRTRVLTNAYCTPLLAALRSFRAPVRMESRRTDMAAPNSAIASADSAEFACSAEV